MASQYFKESGSFRVPDGVFSIIATAIGAGGGGDGHGLGGGGGEYRQITKKVVPGQIVGVTVGAGGAGASPGSGNLGGSGEDTVFKLQGVEFLRAKGAFRNIGGAINPDFPDGGTGSPGGNGGGGADLLDGGGGSAAGDPRSPGQNGASGPLDRSSAPAGGRSVGVGGAGGRGGALVPLPLPGNPPGGGGGGLATVALGGASGASGLAIIDYDAPLSGYGVEYRIELSFTYEVGKPGQIIIECIGGGGGGATDNKGTGAGGGAGGAYAAVQKTVAAGDVLDIVVGAPGTGVVNGRPTTVYRGVTALCIADGGLSGDNDEGGLGTTGATTTGDVVYAGGSGGNPEAGPIGGGGGAPGSASGAGEPADGFLGGHNSWPPNPGRRNQGAFTTIGATAAIAPGGGGGGGCGAQAASPGAAGYVRIRYNTSGQLPVRWVGGVIVLPGPSGRPSGLGGGRP